MNIGLNALGLVAGKIGGVETYFRSLVDSLQREDSDNFYTILCYENDKKQFSVRNPRFSIKAINCNYGTLKWYLRGVLRNVAGLDLFNPFVYECNLDIVHHPFTLLSPTCPRICSVVTFHDLQHEYYPEFFSSFERAYRNKNYRASARNASRIIAISNFTKECLVDRYEVEENKIDVVYPAFGAGFLEVIEKERLDAVRNKYGLDRPFMFYPAATWPHKNHSGLLKAMEILISSYGFDGQLVLTGIAKQAHGELLRNIVRSGLSDHVRILGYLHYEDLPSLYSLARLLVFPSFFEGFGIPLVEAMACGCPVVCSNAASLPEVGGDACFLFSPDSPEEMAGKIWSVWSDETKMEELRSRGFERVKHFEWGRVATQTMKVYQKVAG